MPVIERTPAELLGSLNDVEEKNAPTKLYLYGDESLLQRVPRVSIVGSRKASQGGMERAREYAARLVLEDVVVVSGLAEGIDTAAHETAIEMGGRTIAVLGTGLGSVYPAKNRALQERIAREHLLVSQFPTYAPTKPKYFVMRNRTMALISHATIIVEAGEQSGSLHQGWEALRLGRMLFLDESIVNNSGLQWPAKMMEYGAQKLSLENLEQVIDELPRVTTFADLAL